MLTPDVVTWLIDTLLSTPQPVHPKMKKALVQLSALAFTMKDDTEEAKGSPDLFKRVVFLSFAENSKVVIVTTKKPSTSSGRVSVEVTVNIPKALFHTTQLKATVNIPHGGLSNEALVDVQNALTMAYGSKVELIVQAAENSVVS